MTPRGDEIRVARNRSIAVVTMFLVAAACFHLFAPLPNSDDDLTHFLIAREAWETPSFLMDIWGRPGFTILYCLPAQISFEACRWVSTALCLLCAGFVLGSTGHLSPSVRPWTLLFVLFQATFFLLSFGTLTETVYATFLVMGYWLFRKGHYSGASLAWSWSAVTRMEGAVLLVVLAAARIFVHRRKRREGGERLTRALFDVALLGTFPFLWNLYHVADSGWSDPVALITRNTFFQDHVGYYGSGAWWKFLAQSYQIHGPLILCFVVLGVASAFKRREWLAPTLLLVFYALQSVLWAGGFFRTGGYLRFFVCVAPMAAICAAHGVQQWQSRGILRRFPRASFWTVLIGSLIFACVYSWSQKKPSNLNYSAQEAAAEAIMQDGGVSLNRPVLCRDPYTLVLLGLTKWSEEVLAYNRENLRDCPSGSFVVYSGYRPTDRDAIDVLGFFDDGQSERIQSQKDRGQNWVHLLRRTNARFRELGDFSVLTRGYYSIEDEPYPFYVRVFVKE